MSLTSLKFLTWVAILNGLIYRLYVVNKTASIPMMVALYCLTSILFILEDMGLFTDLLLVWVLSSF